MWTWTGYSARIVAGKGTGMFLRAAADVFSSPAMQSRNANITGSTNRSVKFVLAGTGDAGLVHMMTTVAASLGLQQVRVRVCHWHWQ